MRAVTTLFFSVFFVAYPVTGQLVFSHLFKHHHHDVNELTERESHDLGNHHHHLEFTDHHHSHHHESKVSEKTLANHPADKHESDYHEHFFAEFEVLAPQFIQIDTTNKISSSSWTVLRYQNISQSRFGTNTFGIYHYQEFDRPPPGINRTLPLII